MKVYAPVLAESADGNGMVEVNMEGEYRHCKICETPFNNEYKGNGLYIHPTRGYAICNTNGKRSTCLEVQELEGGVRRGHTHIDEKTRFNIIIEQEMERLHKKTKNILIQPC